MDVRADDRGQAIQIGAIVLFAFLILAFAGYQAVLVPQQNAEVEFRHSQVVADDMVELRTAIVESWATGQSRATTVHLGTTYPPRIMAVNPPPPGGTLTTGSSGSITVEVTGPGGSTQSVCGSTAVPTRALTYTPSYNELSNAPSVIYENSLIYRRYPGDVLFASDQTVVQNRTVNIIPLDTTYAGSGIGAESVQVVPGERTSQTVTLGPNQELEVTFPSNLSVVVWEDLLADEPHANATSPTSDITVTLAGAQPGDGFPPGNPTREYTVNCRKIGLDRPP